MYRILFILLLISTNAEAQKKAEVGQIKTPYGEILIWLYDETPNHKASFIQLAKAHYWDSLTFNRVIPDFVIQGGCPDTKEGFTDSAYLLKPEFVPSLKHEYGTFAAGRDDNAGKYSARCQFYIVVNKQGVHRLDGDYTVYGKIIKGMDVAEKIAHVAKDKMDMPLVPVKLDVNIIKMRIKVLRKMGVDIPLIKTG
ncbi:MAG: peptidylprolyl isomerase [Ginsengibacter sp.]